MEYIAGQGIGTHELCTFLKLLKLIWVDSQLKNVNCRQHPEISSGKILNGIQISEKLVQNVYDNIISFFFKNDMRITLE